MIEKLNFKVLFTSVWLGKDVRVKSINIPKIYG